MQCWSINYFVKSISSESVLLNLHNETYAMLVEERFSKIYFFENEFIFLGKKLFYF